MKRMLQFKASLALARRRAIACFPCTLLPAMVSSTMERALPQPRRRLCCKKRILLDSATLEQKTSHKCGRQMYVCDQQFTATAEIQVGEREIRIETVSFKMEWWSGVGASLVGARYRATTTLAEH